MSVPVFLQINRIRQNQGHILRTSHSHHFIDLRFVLRNNIFFHKNNQVCLVNCTVTPISAMYRKVVQDEASDYVNIFAVEFLTLLKCTNAR